MKTAFTTYRYLRDELCYTYDKAHHLLKCADNYFKHGGKDLFFELYRHEIMQEYEAAARLVKFIDYLGLRDEYKKEISKSDKSAWEEVIKLIQ